MKTDRSMLFFMKSVTIDAWESLLEFTVVATKCLEESFVGNY